MPQIKAYIITFTGLKHIKNIEHDCPKSPYVKKGDTIVTINGWRISVSHVMNLMQCIKWFRNIWEKVICQIGALYCAHKIRNVGCFKLSLLGRCRLSEAQWGYSTSNMLVGYILSNLCLRLCQFSQLFFMQYTGLYVFSITISLMVIVRIHVFYLIIIIKSETCMTHLSLFKVMPWNNGMRCMSCYMVATFLEVFINNIRRILLNLAEHRCMANVNYRYCVLCKTPGRLNCWLTK